MLKYFLSLNFNKSVIIISAILIGYILVLTGQKAYYKYHYFKQIEKNYNTAKDSIASLNEELKDLIREKQIATRKARDNSKSITTKLKADEKAIDARDVSDDELSEFLSRYDQN